MAKLAAAVTDTHTSETIQQKRKCQPIRSYMSLALFQRWKAMVSSCSLTAKFQIYRDAVIVSLRVFVYFLNFQDRRKHVLEISHHLPYLQEYDDQALYFLRLQ